MIYNINERGDCVEDNIDYKFNEIAAKTIKKYRELKNLSLEDVVRRMKTPISRQSLFKYENNLARMKTSTFNDICSALNIDVNDVFEEINRTLIYSSGKLSQETNQPIDVPFLTDSGEIQYAKAFANEEMLNNYLETTTEIDFPDSKKKIQEFDELDILFSKHKDILTDEDKEYMRFIIEKRKKEIDKQLGED